MEGRKTFMSSVYITRAVTHTALGKGLDTLYHGLVKGQTGFSAVDRFDTAPYAGSLAGLIPDIAGPEPSQGHKAAKPMVFTLADRLVRDLGPVDEKSFLITASTKGGIELLDPKAPGPVQGLMVSDLPGYFSEQLGLETRGFNINCACASSTIALAKGADMIRNNQAHTVVVCAMDLITEFVFSGFSALGAMAQGPCTPFDKNRQGLTLGEGGAALVLMDKKAAQRSQSRPLARISGWGIAGDAAHLTAPARDGAGLKLAVKAACNMAKTPLDKIRAVSTHGTGTRYNDAMELCVINELFDPENIMANSIKGAIGHTLGAAGAIEAALCIKMLKHKTLPGTQGLSVPESGAKEIFSTRARSFDHGPLLTVNSGFGGINAALVIEEAAL